MHGGLRGRSILRFSLSPIGSIEFPSHPMDHWVQHSRVRAHVLPGHFDRRPFHRATPPYGSEFRPRHFDVRTVVAADHLMLVAWRSHSSWYEHVVPVGVGQGL